MCVCGLFFFFFGKSCNVQNVSKKLISWRDDILCVVSYFRPSSAAFECLRAFVLHLLDTDWKVCDFLDFLKSPRSLYVFMKFLWYSFVIAYQGYDYTFILDVHLPEFLLDTAKGDHFLRAQDSAINFVTRINRSWTTLFPRLKYLLRNVINVWMENSDRIRICCLDIILSCMSFQRYTWNFCKGQWNVVKRSCLCICLFIF